MFRNLGKTQVLDSRDIGGASQLAESPADASLLVGLPAVRLNLGAFNCGIDQLMIVKPRHQASLGRVICKGVGEQDLHLLNLCEVGGHKKGLSVRQEQAQNIVSKALKPHYKAISRQAYMATWQAEPEPGDATSVTLTPLGDPTIVAIPGSLDPQLVIMVFTIASAELPDRHGLLISGIMHIRAPSGQTSKATRTRILKAALVAMEDKASTVSRGASQPAAPVLAVTGDVNMTKTECDPIVQVEFGDPDLMKHWRVLTSNAAKS